VLEQQGQTHEQQRKRKQGAAAEFRAFRHFCLAP
jgi:hypothetical protein